MYKLYINVIREFTCMWSNHVVKYYKHVIKQIWMIDDLLHVKRGRWVRMFVVVHTSFTSTFCNLDILANKPYFSAWWLPGREWNVLSSTITSFAFASAFVACDNLCNHAPLWLLWSGTRGMRGQVHWCTTWKWYCSKALLSFTHATKPLTLRLYQLKHNRNFCNKSICQGRYNI